MHCLLVSVCLKFSRNFDYNFYFLGLLYQMPLPMQAEIVFQKVEKTIVINFAYDRSLSILNLKRNSFVVLFLPVGVRFYENNYFTQTKKKNETIQKKICDKSATQYEMTHMVVYKFRINNSQQKAR